MFRQKDLHTQTVPIFFINEHFLTVRKKTRPICFDVFEQTVLNLNPLCILTSLQFVCKKQSCNIHMCGAGGSFLFTWEEDGRRFDTNRSPPAPECISMLWLNQYTAVHKLWAEVCCYTSSTVQLPLSGDQHPTWKGKAHEIHKTHVKGRWK